MGRKVIDLRQKKPGLRHSGSQLSTTRRSTGGKSSPLRARRMKIRLYGAAIACTMFIASLPYISDLTYRTRFSLGDINVVGVTHIPANLVKAYIEKTLYDGTYHFLSKTNIFWYPKEVLEQEVRTSIPRIKTANIKRNGLLAQAVTVSIEERKRFGVWCDSSGGCYEMDDTGFIFAGVSPSVTAREYIFSGTLASSTEPIGQTYLGQYIQNVAAFLELLEKKGLKPNRISSDGDIDYWVELTNSVSLRVALAGSSEEMARNLELALSSEALRDQVESVEYIDLRFGNKLYYKTR